MDVAELIRIANLAVPPLSYESHSQLLMLLLKGFLVDDGKMVTSFLIYIDYFLLKENAIHWKLYDWAI